MEDMQGFINNEHNKKIEENSQKVIDLFKEEVKKEGGTFNYEARYGDIHPRFYISDGISAGLKAKISAYVSQFYKRDDLLG